MARSPSPALLVVVGLLIAGGLLFLVSPGQDEAGGDADGATDRSTTASTPGADEAAKARSKKKKKPTRRPWERMEPPAPEGEGEAEDALAEDEPEEAKEELDLRAQLEKELDEWRKEGVVHATCRLEPPIETAEGYLAIGGHSDFNGRRVIVLDGVAHLPILKDYAPEGHEYVNQGLLSIEGYAPAETAWSLPEGAEGSCNAPVQLKPGGTVITGKVTLQGSGAPALDAWVEGCGNLGFTDEDGVYYMEAVPGPCTLIAMRQDGEVRTLGMPTPVEAVAGKDLVVDLTILATPRAGLGVAVKPGEQGMVVEEVHPGSGAEAAGLQEGDLIVSVEGESAAGMDMTEFVVRVGGEAGSTVTLAVVGEDGEQREIEVERKPLG